MPYHHTQRGLFTLGLLSGVLACSPAHHTRAPVGPAQVPAAPLTTTAESTPPPPANKQSDRIRVDIPSAGQRVQSPLEVTGQARGGWFFEANFPVLLLDANSQVLVQHYAQAQGEWMTDNFVPFSAKLTFARPTTPTGTLVLKRANASGLPEHDEELRIPLSFE